MADRVMLRRRPSSEILSGESADVYFARAEEILRREGLDPMVTMEVFARQEAVLCGIDEAKILIAHALEKADPDEVSVEGLDDGDTIASKEIVLRIRARYREFGLYETAILGMMAQATGWGSPPRPGGAPAAPPPAPPPRPPRRHRRARLRRDRRRLRGRLHAGRRASRRPRPDRHDAPFARADLRGAGDGSRGLRPRTRAGGAAHRARGHLQGRGP